MDAGAEVFDYGNSIRDEARRGGFDRAFAFPGFVPAYIRPLFCEGKGPFRWAALSGDPKDIHATDQAVLDLFPDNDRLHRWIHAAQERVAFQGLPARICWLGYGERDKAGVRFNEMVASGELSAPIVIGRDHLDCGSVASPYRETEAMADGSDAIADWPLLNALVNTASGATWVSIHHGGGVGHRPLDPRRPGDRGRRHRRSPRQKIERVLTNDPGMGVIRHVDAGYAPDDARCRRTRSGGVRVPMRSADSDVRPALGRPRPGRAVRGSPAGTGASPGRRATRPCASGSPASAAARGLDLDDRPGRQPVGVVGRPGRVRARASSSARTWTRCPTAAPSTGRSAW